MKVKIILLIATTLLSLHLLGQNSVKFYYDMEGKKADPQQAQYYLTNKGNDNYKGFYVNEKLFFTGKLIRIDTANSNLNIYKDSCVWFYKNGNRKFARNYDQDGKLHGSSKEYYESGSLWKEYNYSHNSLDDNTYSEYLEDGQRYSIFEDNFNDNTSDWELIQNQDQDVQIANGNLVLTAKNKEGISRFKYLKFNKEDFILEAKIEFLKSKKDDQGGIIYGFKDWNNYNFFFINKENLFIGSVYEGLKSYAINDMFSNAINEKGYNTIKIISNGSDALYSINGKIVYKSTKFPFYGNNFGVAALGKYTMNVDQLTFKQVSYSVMGKGAESHNQQNEDVKATGTGFFIHPSGIIATNFHVIENQKQLIVEVLDTVSSTYRAYKATVLMKDMDNDLAILKIADEAFKPKFDVMDYSFATTNSFELGSNAFTLGFPLALSGMGSGEVKFSDGKISAKTGYEGALNSFQTTIPVQPGNSGGPIFNSAGELIGIINSKVAKADNVSYGIKNNFLINLIQSLPDNVELSKTNLISTYSLEDKIKKMKKYIVLIKVK